MEKKEELNKSYLIYWASGIVSICGIIFEVMFGALGSYILGDGVKQYTLTISLFLTGMGIGASLSERVLKQLILSFIYIELAIALIGGFSSFAMFGMTAYSPPGSEALFLYTITFLVGALTGVELPILIRKANEIGVALNRSTARVLFSDYAGGLIGGLLFVYWLRPNLGMVKSAFFVGCINAAVALLVIWLFRRELKRINLHLFAGFLVFCLLVGGLFFGEGIAFNFEQKLYKDPILEMQESNYQKIVLTERNGDTRLYLDGGLQFSSVDEHRYHEVLVHPAMSLVEERRDILILGGGDGIAAKEVLKYPEVESITLVDLDPAVVELASTHPLLTKLNDQALKDEKVKVRNEDAYKFLENSSGQYDVIVIDLPDPNNESLNKLYTREFYSLARNHLNPSGYMSIQATSPVFAREVYWTISETVASTGLNIVNLHVDIPSFGNWGFVLAGRMDINMKEAEIIVPTKFLTDDVLPGLSVFGKDENEDVFENGRQVLIEPNTLINPHLIEKYEDAWQYY